MVESIGWNWDVVVARFLVHTFRRGVLLFRKMKHGLE